MAEPAVDDAWSLAKARFLEDLDPKEQDIFRNATLENLYYSTSNIDRNDSDNSKSRLLARKIGPLVSAIESYGKALDTFTNIAPLYLAPIWGSIRVVLVLASAYGRFYDRIIDTLGRIGDVMPRFRDYERIYNRAKHQRLTQALSNAYLDIIVLCTQFRRSIREQKASSFRRILKPLSSDRQFDEAVERFRRHKQNVEEEARTCHMIEAAEERSAQLVLRTAERRAKLLSRLSKVDCRYRHRTLSKTRHDGTGLWLSECDAYCGWDSSPGSAVLCCFGIPGSGKSVLASIIIDNIGIGQGNTFYYCDYADKRTLEPANVFGTIAREILASLNLIPEPLATDIEKVEHDGERIIDHSKALDLLKRSIDLLTTPVRLVFDGLDEATENSQKIISNGFRDILESPSTPLKLLITGREELGSLLRIDPKILFWKIPISAKTIALDIDRYVRASTRRRIVDGSLVIQDPTLEETIVEELVKGAKGMFLWVEFQLQDLSQQETDRGIKLVLQNLPRSLSETYDRLLGKIEGADRRNMIEKMFKWIVVARQPLCVDELREGIAFELEDEEWDREKVPTDFNRLVRACGNLVVINEETQVVQLAHYTVQQYLLQPGESHFHFTVQEGNSMIGEICVAYLNFTNFETQITPFKENVNTDMVALSRIAGGGQLLSLDNPGRRALRVWNAIRPADTTVADINMARFLPKSKPKPANLTAFSLLTYIATHWLWHTIDFKSKEQPHHPDSYRVQRRDDLLTKLVLWKSLSFDFRPWESFNSSDTSSSSIGLLGWALMTNHSYLIEIASRNDGPLEPGFLILEACDWFLSGEFVLWPALPSMPSKKLFSTKGISELDSIELPYESRRPEVLLNKLKAFSEDSYTLESPGLGWLCSKLLYACRKGHIEAIQLCDTQIIKAYGSKERCLQKHLLLQAAAFGQLEVVKYVCDTTFIRGNLSAEINSRTLNALEYAVVGGHLQTAAFLHGKGLRIHNLYRNSESYFDLVDSAIENDNWELLKALMLLTDVSEQLQQGSSTWSTPTLRSKTALFSAIRKGQHRMVVSMVLGGVVLNVVDDYGYSPLLLAISLRNLLTAEFLAKQSGDTLRTFHDNTNCSTLCHIAGSDLDTHIILSPTPLYLACYHGSNDMVQMLLDAGADPACLSPVSSIRIGSDSADNPVRNYGRTHMPSGITDWQHPNTTHILSSLSDWQYPIMAALTEGHIETAQLLLQAGAITPRVYISTEPNVELAVENLRKELAKINVSTGIEVVEDLGGRHQHTIEKALFTTLANNIDSISKQELYISVVAGADVDELRLGGLQALLWALKHNYKSLAQLILRRTNDYLETVQHTFLDAVETGLQSAMAFLLEQGASISQMGEDGIQVPHASVIRAAIAGDELLQRVIRDEGRLVSIGSSKEKDMPSSRLGVHSQYLQQIVGCIFLESGRRFDSVDWYCKTIKKAATSNWRCADLLDAYFGILICSPAGTALDYEFLYAAVENGSCDMVDYLCHEEGLNINCRQLQGYTPLIYAIQYGQSKEMLGTLISLGSDLVTEDNDGQTALDKALLEYSLEENKLRMLAGEGSHPDRVSLKIQQRALYVCMSSGNSKTWKKIAQRELYEAVVIDGVEYPSYTKGRGHYLLSSSCRAVPGVHEMFAPFDVEGTTSPEPKEPKKQVNRGEYYLPIDTSGLQSGILGRLFGSIRELL